MFTKVSMAEPFKDYPKRSACPECGEALIIKWDSVGDGKNIILTPSHAHEKKVQEKQSQESFWEEVA